MKKAVYRNWTPLLTMAGLLFGYAIVLGDLIAALIVDVPALLLMAGVFHWVHAPQGLLCKTEFVDGVATVTHVLRKTTRTVDLKNAAYLYKLKKVMPFLVASDEPLSTKQEALAAYKAGKAGFVLRFVGGDAMYPYEKKAKKLS